MDIETIRRQIREKIGTIRRILIVRMSAFGDIVHSMHAVAGLKKALPDVEIGWLTSRKLSGLVRCATFVNTVHTADTSWKPIRLLKEVFRIKKELSGRYDIVVDVQGLLKSAVAAKLSGSKVLGYSGNECREGAGLFYKWGLKPSEKAVHVVEKQVELLSAITPVTAVRKIEYVVPEAEVKSAREKFPWVEENGYAIVHRMTRWPSKNLPVELLFNIVSGLELRGHKVVVTAADDGDAGELKKILNGTKARLVRNTSIGELVWIIQRASLFIGPDTGPTHLASASGVPTVAIYGPTNPERNGPYGPVCISVRTAVMDCKPCWKKNCSRGPNECMKRVTVEQVMKGVEEVLQRG